MFSKGATSLLSLANKSERRLTRWYFLALDLSRPILEHRDQGSDIPTNWKDNQIYIKTGCYPEILGKWYFKGT